MIFEHLCSKALQMRAAILLPTAAFYKDLLFYVRDPINKGVKLGPISPLQETARALTSFGKILKRQQ